MALSGRLVADFDSFFKAVETAEVKLRSFETGAEKVSGALNRMANSFSGQKIIQDATLMTEALARTGGASTLTAREMARVNATVTEAIAKYTALGQTAPPAMVALANATKHVGEAAAPATRSVGLLGGAFTQVFAAFSAASLVNKAVGALTDLATQAFETADTLVNLSNKTGLSTDTLQRMQFVAKQSGSDMGAFSDAAFKMGVNVAEGSKKAREGAEALGLSWSALRSASPDDQFNMVVTALEAMEDPQARNAAAVALFGKTAKEILPAIVDGYTKVASGATVAGEAQIRAADRAGDAWDRFKTTLVGRMINAVGSIILLREAVAELSEGERAYIQQSMAATATTDDFSAALIRAAEAKGKFGNVGLPGSGKDINLPAPPKAVAGDGGFVADLKAAEEAYRHLTAAKIADIAAAVQLKRSDDDIINTLNITDGVLALVKKGFDDQKAAVSKSAEALKQSREAWTEYGSTVGSVTEQLSGATIEGLKWDLARNVQAGVLAKTYEVTAAQVAAVVDLLKKETDAKKLAFDAATKLTTALAKEAEETRKIANARGVALLAAEAASYDAREKALEEFNDAVAKDTMDANDFERYQEQKKLDAAEKNLKRLGESYRDAYNFIVATVKIKLSEIGALWTTAPGMKDPAAPATKSVRSLGDALDDLARDFTQMATIAGDSFGDVSRVVGTAIVAMNAASKATTAFQAASRSAAGAGAADYASLAAGWLGVANAIWNIVEALNEEQAREVDAAIAQHNMQIAMEHWATTVQFTTELVADAQATLMDFVRELGGLANLSAAQLDLLIDRARIMAEALKYPADVFGKLRDDMLNQLDDILMAFTETAEQGGLVSQGFLDILRQVGDEVVNLPNVSRFLTQQAASAATGLSALLGGLQDSATAKAKAAAQVQIDALKALIAGASGATKTKLEEQLKAAEEAQKALVGVFTVTEAQGAGLAAAILADFGAMVEHGATFREALKALQPAIDNLRSALAASGVDGGAAFGLLGEMSSVAQNAITGPLVDALQGADQALKGLHNSGILNQEMFTGLELSAVDAYNKMIAGGASAAAANMFIAPTLQTLWALQKDFGYAVDEATQALINEAVAAGRVGDKHRPVAEQMLIATERIADAVEGLARVFGVILPDAAKAGARKIEDALGDIEMPVLEFRTVILEPEGGWPTHPLPVPTGAGSGPIIEGGAQAFGGDYLVRRPTHFLAGEAGAERVQFTPVGRRAASGSGAPTTVIVKTYLDGRQVAESVVPELVGVMDRFGLRR